MSRKNVPHSNNVQHYFSNTVLISLLMITNLSMRSCLQSDIWEKVGCNEYFHPDNCDFEKIPLLTVDDFYRCGPANLNLTARNYFLGAAGERITYNENKRAYKRLRIIPTYLMDVSKSSSEIKTLGQTVAFPIGLSPTALHKYAHPDGEVATLKAIAEMGTVMMLSSYATTTIEEAAQYKGSSHLWMQTIIHSNRSFMVDIVRRAEKSGFEAIVVTLDMNHSGTVTCNGRASKDIGELELANFPGYTYSENFYDRSATFKIISWLKTITKLPIVAKGILTAADARLAAIAGASAILVSNHGGRQLDSVPATIEVLSEVVNAVKVFPRIDVYIDGGVRTGQDVYKAIAMGAKMAFIGRPILFGLAKEGESGVRKVMNILKREFEETMLISGAANPSKITKYNVKPAASQC